MCFAAMTLPQWHVTACSLTRSRPKLVHAPLRSLGHLEPQRVAKSTSAIHAKSPSASSKLVRWKFKLRKRRAVLEQWAKATGDLSHDRDLRTSSHLLRQCYKAYGPVCWAQMRKLMLALMRTSCAKIEQDIAQEEAIHKIVCKNTTTNTQLTTKSHAEAIQELSNQLEKQRQDAAAGLANAMLHAIEQYAATMSEAIEKHSAQLAQAVELETPQELQDAAKDFSDPLRRTVNSEPSQTRATECTPKSKPPATTGETMGDPKSTAPATAPETVPPRPHPHHFLSKLEGEEPQYLIDLDKIKPHSAPVRWRDDSEYMCSYTVHCPPGERYTLDVPGDVRTFEAPVLPFQFSKPDLVHESMVSPTRGPPELNQKFAQVFQALSALGSSHKLDAVDILADVGTLEGIWRMVRDRGAKRWIEVQLVGGKTLVVSSLLPWFYAQEHPPSYTAAYVRGREFEANFTRSIPGMSGRNVHERVTRHTLGPLTVAARQEIDAVYEGPEGTDRYILAARGEKIKNSAAEVKDAFFQDCWQHYQPTPGAPKVRLKGTVVPHSRLVELKSGHAQRLARSAWFRRMSHYVIGLTDMRQSQACIMEWAYLDMEKRARAWEAREQKSLRRMISLLLRLQEIAKAERAKRGPRVSLRVRYDAESPQLAVFVRERESPDEDLVDAAYIKEHWGKETKKHTNTEKAQANAPNAVKPGRAEAKESRSTNDKLVETARLNQAEAAKEGSRKPWVRTRAMLNTSRRVATRKPLPPYQNRKILVRRVESRS